MQALWTVPLNSFLAQRPGWFILPNRQNGSVSETLGAIVLHTGSIREQRLPKSHFGASGRIFTQSGNGSSGAKIPQFAHWVIGTFLAQSRSGSKGTIFAQSEIG
jgi:hypothetical protein